MRGLFYSAFGAEHITRFLFCVERTSLPIMEILAKESAANNRHVLILGHQPIPYPIEGKVLISPETEFLLQLIEDEEPRVIYLAKGISDDLLLPYEMSDINRFASEIQTDMMLFLQLAPDDDIEGYLAHQPGTRCVCVLNYKEISSILFADTRSKQTPGESTLFKRIHKIVSEHCPLFDHAQCRKDAILFIDQVKNLLEENMLLSVLRKYNQRFEGHLLIGDVTRYHVRELQ